MRYTEYLILGILEEEGITLKEVCNKINSTSAWVSECLTNLTSRNFVKKTIPKTKGYRNRVYFTLTPQGKELNEYFHQTKDKLGLRWEECLEYKKI